MGPRQPPLRRQHALDGRRDAAGRSGLLRCSASRPFRLRLQAFLQLDRDCGQQLQMYPAVVMHSVSVGSATCNGNPDCAMESYSGCLRPAQRRAHTSALLESPDAPFQLAWPQAGTVRPSLSVKGLQHGKELLQLGSIQTSCLTTLHVTQMY